MKNKKKIRENQKSIKGGRKNKDKVILKFGKIGKK